MKEVLEFLKNSGVFYIATVDGDKPRVRPFGALCDFEDKIYLITSNQKDVYKQIATNPNIEISSMTKDGKWIRLSAKAVTDSRKEPKTAILDANPELRGMYDEDDKVMEVFYLSDVTATICSFTDAPVTYNF